MKDRAIKSDFNIRNVHFPIKSFSRWNWSPVRRFGLAAIELSRKKNLTKLIHFFFWQRKSIVGLPVNLLINFLQPSESWFRWIELVSGFCRGNCSDYDILRNSKEIEDKIRPRLLGPIARVDTWRDLAVLTIGSSSSVTELLGHLLLVANFHYQIVLEHWLPILS